MLLLKNQLSIRFLNGKDGHKAVYAAQLAFRGGTDATPHGASPWSAARAARLVPRYEFTRKALRRIA